MFESGFGYLRKKMLDCVLFFVFELIRADILCFSVRKLVKK